MGGRGRRVETSTNNVEKTLLKSRATGGFGVKISNLSFSWAWKWMEDTKELLLMEPENFHVQVFNMWGKAIFYDLGNSCTVIFK